jgi:hypothetical protein
MASRISEGTPVENEFQKAGTKDLEATQIVEIQDWSDYGDDTKTANSEDSEAMVAVCGIILCRPFVCRMWSVGMFLLAFLLMGLGVGLTVRENTSKSRAFAAAQGEGTDAGQAVGGVPSTGTVQPSGDTSTTSPQESLSPSSYPTPFFEIDVDEYLDENTDLALELSTDNGNLNVEWDNSASPYLVGAYYYPWYGKFLQKRNLSEEQRASSISRFFMSFRRQLSQWRWLCSQRPNTSAATNFGRIRRFQAGNSRSALAME